MEDNIKENVEELKLRVAALSALMTDTLGILANVAPVDFKFILRRQRRLVQAIENGTFQTGDGRTLTYHRTVRDLLEQSDQKKDEYFDEGD
jgi:hypothetical protein